MKMNINDYKWYKKYVLAKVYYEHHGDLEIPQKFKTKDGYTYDENGVSLGMWVANQRQALKGNGTHIIDSERIIKLQKIGMNFNTDYYDKLWQENYGLAEKYFKRHDNLDIPVKFKTINGCTYDENGVALGKWLDNQRQAYKSKRSNMINMISSERIELLENIGMKWFSDNIDIKLQKEIITEENKSSKNKELVNRLYSVLNKIDSDSINEREINNLFMDALDKPKVKKKSK